MSATVTIEGMDDLRAALRQLPQDLTDEAAGIVSGYAAQAQQEISSGYPQGPTGNLKNRVTVTNNAGRRFGTVSIVKSAAPHASIFEKGTKVRQTGKGYNRGAMPEPPESERMIPKVIRLRQRMVSDLIALVQRAGFEVGE